MKTVWKIKYRQRFARQWFDYEGTLLAKADGKTAVERLIKVAGNQTLDVAGEDYPCTQVQVLHLEKICDITL